MVMVMKPVNCAKCKIEFWIPDSFETTMRQMGDQGTFYCPAGHPQHFPFGETEAQKYRRERDRLKQQLAQKDDEIKRQRELREAAERSVSAQKGQVTRLKNRAKAGVCPCCNRTFHNLQRHMASQHPDFGAETETAA